MTDFIKLHQKHFNFKQFILDSFIEDVGDGDHTSLSTIPKNHKGKMHLLVKEDGIIAGLTAAEKIFKQVDKNFKLKVFIKDELEEKLTGANIKILLGEKIFHESVISLDTFELQVPLTAEIIISKEGFKGDHFSISDNEKILQLYLELTTVEKGGAKKLADPSIYKKLREDLMITIQHRKLISISKE